MNSKPKILVFRMREIIYTLLLILFVVLLLLCMFLMFTPGHTTANRQNASGTTETQQNTASQTDTLTRTAENASEPSTNQQKLSTGTQTNSTEIPQTAADSGSAGSAADSNSAGNTANAAETAGSSSAVNAPGTETVSSSAVTAQEDLYTPGVYTVPIYLNDAALNVEVTIDADHINSIRLVNLSKSIETMYPLVSPSLDHIATQILQKQSLEGITSPQSNRYTSQLLLNAVSDAISMAQKK